MIHGPWSLMIRQWMFWGANVCFVLKEIPLVLLIVISLASSPKDFINWKAMTTQNFQSVINTATIRIVLSMATTHRWSLHQLNVQNAFLHGELQEQVYMSQPSGFTHTLYPNHICQVKNSLYDLKNKHSRPSICVFFIFSSIWDLLPPNQTLICLFTEKIM